MKASSILGLNSRTQRFSYPYNRHRGKRIANSKILTRRALRRLQVPTPKIYKVFQKPSDILEFDFSSLPSSFAIKPNKGLGGNGIIVVKKRAKEDGSWITTDRRKITAADIQSHLLDILEGAYSKRNVPDTGFIQEYVGRHKVFRKYAYRGTPDIRIIVFNRVPVMAMLRLPTKTSGGRANLHQGAIGVGVDIATGITTRAILGNQRILYKPGTKRKLNGIKIPDWEEMLQIAASCNDVPGLGYMGVDIVLHPEKGPMVLELNSQPGLQLQLCNSAGLKKRLERVEDLEVKTPDQGVKIAKALFSASFADRVRAEKGIKTLSLFEDIKILNAKKKKITVRAKIDTGAWRSSMDKELAEELGLLTSKNILWERKFKSALGVQKRVVISTTFWLKGRKIETVASTTTRKSLKYRLIIGRKDLIGFLVNPRSATK